MPPTLGQRLKHAREHADLSLADVAHRTRIPVPRLQDLEQDNFTAFGSLTYARSFLESYADFLGVDPHSVTSHMNPTPLGGARDYRYLTESLGRWIGTNPADRTLMPAARPVRNARISGAVAVICGILLLITGVIWAAAYWNEHNVAQKPPPLLLPTPVKNDAAPAKIEPDAEEIRPAVPHKLDNVPVKKALPVNDDPKAKPKR